MKPLLPLLSVLNAAAAPAAPPPGPSSPAQAMDLLLPGGTIRCEDGAMMASFYGRLLERTFPGVMCVGHVAAVAR